MAGSIYIRANIFRKCYNLCCCCCRNLTLVNQWHSLNRARLSFFSLQWNSNSWSKLYVTLPSEQLGIHYFLYGGIARICQSLPWTLSTFTLRSSSPGQLLVEIFKYRMRSTWAAALGWRWRVRIPFLFPTTRVISENEYHIFVQLYWPHYRSWPHSRSVRPHPIPVELVTTTKPYCVRCNLTFTRCNTRIDIGQSIIERQKNSSIDHPYDWQNRTRTVAQRRAVLVNISLEWTALCTLNQSDWWQTHTIEGKLSSRIQLNLNLEQRFSLYLPSQFKFWHFSLLTIYLNTNIF